MGGCLATIFKGGNKKHIYRPIRTGTTAKYGTNSRDQSYLGRGYTGGGDTSSGRNKSKSKVEAMQHLPYPAQHVVIQHNLKEICTNT